MSKSSFPQMRPEELIALLDAMGAAGLCARRKKGGETVYTLTLEDICEADAILDGSFDPKAEE